MSKHFVMMAGGTGGHIFPALAVAKVLQAQGHTVTWLGSSKRMETRLVPQAGFSLDTLTIQGLRGKGVLSYLALPWRLGRAIWQARYILKKRQPDWIIGMGGFATGPGGIAAKWLGISLVIHEQNSRAGWTNRLLSRWARQVFCAYPGAFPAHTNALCIGNPIRQSLIDHAQVAKKTTRKTLRILVVGGSLGAWAINKILPEALANLSDLPYQVRHQSGETTYQQTCEQYQAHQIKADITPFIEDMATAYQWADMVICRAGALTVSELTIMGKPAIFIPLPHAVDNHQYFNAQWLVKHKAALLVEQKDLTAHTLAQQIQTLADSNIRFTMASQAQALAQPDATQQLVAWLIQPDQKQTSSWH